MQSFVSFLIHRCGNACCVHADWGTCHDGDDGNENGDLSGLSDRDSSLDDGDGGDASSLDAYHSPYR